MAERPVAISVRNLVKTFDGRTVLDGVTLDIYQGETFVIMGGSGCGKSTLLRHMTGAIKPDAGQVYFQGKDLTLMTEEEKERIKRRFGMSFQSAALIDYMTVEENVSLPLREHTKLDPQIISIIVKMKLNLVGLQGYEHLMPSMLSGGMKKRVGLARAIAMDPEVVFYDEPTAGLDPIVSAVVDKLILDLNKKLLLTSVVVTHNMESVFRIANRVAMLHQGRVLEVGTPKEIKNSGNAIVQQFLKGEIEGPINIMENGHQGARVGKP
ncbi:MAG TPA: ABC transporter ATP-binding protein [Candidatus Omnitrophota bacterium]|jgi:phospholipid/cholesterol/gamma-HCH transport system ATP-binding protein|nr:ABC transporter ATP-binding protein [Candidatus Omnitrophota bacterium]HPN55248.1 ABC transporter ATP-binding protein [Candidatus Omnitrophota bacterium]